MNHSPPQEPSRAIGGEAFARRAAVPSGGNAVNSTEDVRKYAAEPSGANRSAAEIARQTLLSTVAGKQIIRRMTRRASREASQHAISEEEALQRGMEEKCKEFVEAGAEVYAKAWIQP